MKLGICAILKNENLYLREWVEHHLNLGFDKIFIYDNNNIDGEYPNTVIQDYVDKGYIDIVNYRGKVPSLNFTVNPQIEAYNDCLYKHTDYDWILFIDIDEFLELETHSNIHQVFDTMHSYNKYDAILLNSCWYGDNDKLYYENDSVQNRFKEEINGYDAFGINVNCVIKSFVNTKFNTYFGYNCHHPAIGNICDVTGNPYEITDRDYYMPIPIYNVMWYKHYYTKSLTEFLYKTIYFWGVSKTNLISFNCKLDNYKNLNGWSDEKEQIYQNFLKTNGIIS